MYIFVCPVFLCLVSRWLKASRVDSNKSSFGDHTTSTKVYTYKGRKVVCILIRVVKLLLIKTIGVLLKLFREDKEGKNPNFNSIRD